MRICSWALGVLALAMVAGCTCSSPASTRRSGTVDEPYVEEPLPDAVADKEPFLQTSNQVIAALAAGNPDAAYALMNRRRIQREKFDGMVKTIGASHGGIVGYLPMQWWFIDDGRQLLSVKLVIFEQGCGAARLMFDPNEPTEVRDVWLGGNTCSPNALAAREKL